MTQPWILPIKRLVLSDKTGEWCQLPYHNHPKGCPKYKTPGCPPYALHISERLNLNRPLFIVHSEFDLVAHVQNMKAKHPLWSEYQWRCVLYWQESSRKQLRERVKFAHWELNTNAETFCPEGQGVNVYATCFLAGLKLEKIKNLKTCRHVAIVGESK